MNKSKRVFSVILVLVMLLVSVPLSGTVVSSADRELEPIGEASIYYIETYEQLKAHALKAQSEYRYILEADIEVDDNENDNEIVISEGSVFNLDLNGYSIKRSTQGNDCALFRIKRGGTMTIRDTSDFQTGYCSFSEGYASYYKAVFYNDGGELEILGGYYEIFSPFEQGDCSIVRATSGSTYIYDGTFDSSYSWGGDTISVGHNAYLYEVPEVVIFGGNFYGKYSNIDIAPFDNYLKNGCLYPSVYVLGGNFYVTKNSESTGFAYCNNGWGMVLVAEGKVPSSCLNSRDQRFISGVSKKYVTDTIDDYTRGYYEVTAPPMIISDGLDYYYRLIGLCDKEVVKSYGDSVYELHKENFDLILDRIDTVMVSDTEKEAPMLTIENRTSDHQYVNWYICDESEYCGADTKWTHIGDAYGVSSWQPEERPEGNESYLVRVVLTDSKLVEYEDIIRINYEALKTAETVETVEIKDINIPKTGENPDFDFTSEDSFYVNAVYWTDATDPQNRVSMKETDTFEAGHKYELEIWIRANEGYKFKMDSDDCLDISAVVGGKEAEVILPGTEISAELLITFEVEGGADIPTTPTAPSENTNPTEPSSPMVIGVLGDSNEDFKVNVKDATLIQKYAASLATLSETQLVLSDVNSDEKVNVKDATVIQKYAAGMNTGFPVGDEIII